MPEYRFPAHHVHQSNLYGGQAAVARYKVKGLMVAHDLRVAARGRPGHHIVHHVGKGQGQVVGLSLAQHFCEVALEVHVQQQDFLALQNKTDSRL